MSKTRSTPPPQSPVLAHLRAQIAGLQELLERMEAAVSGLSAIDTGAGAELIVALELLEAKLDRLTLRTEGLKQPDPPASEQATASARSRGSAPGAALVAAAPYPGLVRERGRRSQQ
jgi:hypothetical protein